MKLLEIELSLCNFCRRVLFWGCLLLASGWARGDTGMKIKTEVQGVDASGKYVDVIFTRPAKAPARVYGVEAVIFKKGQPAIVRRYAVCMGAGTFHAAFGDDSHCFSQTSGAKATADGWYVRVMRMGKQIALEGSAKDASKTVPTWTPKAPYQHLWGFTTNVLPSSEGKCSDCNGFGRITAKLNNKVKADKDNKEPCPHCQGTGTAKTLDWSALHRELTLRDVDYLTKSAAERKALDDKDSAFFAEILKEED